MIRFITVEKLIAELQKHDSKLPIVLKVNQAGDIPPLCQQLRHWDGEDPCGHLSDLFVYESEFANNMGQQGLGLFLSFE